MSTRSQIKLKNSTNNIHIYKHSDGYPEGVLPVLVPFVKDFMAERGYEEDYILAQIVRRFAVVQHYENLKFREKYPQLKGSSDYEFLGWGLDCEKHGDIQYLYEIDEKGAIYVNGKKLTKAELAKWTNHGKEKV